jgi:alpha-ketoglutarate-dependent taurine dioxygenase
MKVSKIPGLGRFGVFVDDVDLANISNDEWTEIGKLHLNSLVTIVRNTNLTPARYQELIGKWGDPRAINSYQISKKYKRTLPELLEQISKNNTHDIDIEDVRWLEETIRIAVKDQHDQVTYVTKITGKKNEKGEAEGMFNDGELLWHSNESGNLTFTPGVSLLAIEGVTKSATGFVTTTDWYERQSAAFRSELDEMICFHKFVPGKINPGLSQDQDFYVYKNMCPVDNTAIPLVIKSPGGITGLHYSVNTVHSIRGMSQAESDKLFDKINKELFTDEFVYDHWYKQNGDLCLFDNSITLHRRLGETMDRMCYRVQYDYTRLQDAPYIPYSQAEFARPYARQIRDIAKHLGLVDFKLPPRHWTDFVPGLT